MVTREQLIEDFGPRVRDELAAQGMDPEVKPTQRWLRDNDFWEVFTYCRDREETVDDLLLTDLGFDERPSKPLPGHSTETKQWLHKFFREEEELYNRINNSSVDDLPTHMRTLMTLCIEVHGHADLLKIAHAGQREQFFTLRDLYKALEDHHDTEGSAYNYASTLVEFFDWLQLQDEIDEHCADEVRDRFDWSYERDGPNYVLTPREVWKLWNATKTLIEKLIILLLFGSGLRPNDIVILTEDMIHFDDGDPHLDYGGDRKNGPGKPVVMAGVTLLKRQLEILKQDPDWNGSLLPSDDSASGSREYGYIRARFDDVVARSDVEINREDYNLTPTAGRDFYMNMLAEARHNFMLGVSEPVSDAAGSSSERVVNKHYLEKRRNRKFFQRYAHSYFEAAFGDHVTSPPDEEEEPADLQSDQTRITEWGDSDDERAHAGIGGIGSIVSKGTNAIDERVTSHVETSLLTRLAPLESTGRRAAISISGILIITMIGVVTVQAAEPSLQRSVATLIAGLSIGVLNICE